MEQEAYNKLLKDAQYRKGLSIAFFNATNAAIELVKNLPCANSEITQDQTKRNISEWRDWFLSEHKKYYSEVVAGVGATYDAKKTIDRLKECKSKDELRSVWVSISEDERRDGEIIKVAKQLKTSFK